MPMEMWGSKDSAHEVSNGSRRSIGNWNRDHSLHSGKAFETLWEAELKGDRLISLVYGIPRHSSF